MSSKETSAPLPQFSPNTRVFHRDESDTYASNAYQYSSSSHKTDLMLPAVVIYPANIDDIILVVNYARDNGVGIAVRTGGHQYSGASSTTGDNIQLDLSDTFQSADDFSYDASNNLLRIGISFSLLEMNTLLGKNGLFVPHGVCVHVHLGGHVQTGGYGQLGRSFGLLCDHVDGFDIVLASGELKTIRKPNSENADENMTKAEKEFNDDLYWAVVGGSPGNYGILTHVYLHPCQDKDYPDSRGMKLFTLYSKEKLEKVLQVVAEMNDEVDLPRDFDACLTLMTDAWNGYPFRKLFEIFKKPNYANIDEKMMHEFPEQYGDGVEWAEKGKMSIPAIPTPAILIYLQWANVNGAEEKFGDKEKVWFDKILEASHPNILHKGLETLYDGPLAPVHDIIKRIMGDADVRNWLYVDHEEHTPMSELTRYWCYEDVREFIKPYEKRVYASNKNDLSTNGWVQCVSSSIDEIASGEDNDMDVVVQIQIYGGNNSMYRLNGRPEMHNGSHSWRDQTTIALTLDCFYQPQVDDERVDERLKNVMKWQSKNDECAQKGGVFCEEDRRLLWASYSRMDDADSGANLYTVRSKYYDSEEKYNKLVEIKRRVDPDYVFTANLFGVDANNAPENKQVLILGRGHNAATEDNPNATQEPEEPEEPETSCCVML